ncbi:MAG: hypothetical protein IJ767_03975 [Bacteroidaceae bacterium]|nr:hypothetical protein [Bacteroidaceae bacterium]
MRLDNYRCHTDLRRVEVEQLENVLRQYGKRVDFENYGNVDTPVLIVQLKHGWVGDVKFTSIWLNEDGDICCEAEDCEWGDDVKVNIPSEVSFGFMGYLTEAVVNVGKAEGVTLGPCRYMGAPIASKSLLQLAEEADNAVLDYLSRHDYDGNLSFNEDTLTIFLGGMSFEVGTLFVNSNCNPAAFGTSYEMEADIRINSLGRDNLESIIEYCNNH